MSRRQQQPQSLLREQQLQSQSAPPPQQQPRRIHPHPLPPTPQPDEEDEQEPEMPPFGRRPSRDVPVGKEHEIKRADYYKTPSGAEDHPGPQPTYDFPPQNPAAIESNSKIGFRHRHRRLWGGTSSRGVDSGKVVKPTESIGGGFTHEFARLTLEDREAAGQVDDGPNWQVPDPQLFRPRLSVKCGPLLRYTGLRRDDASARSPQGGRETWRGSVMILTTDSGSDYSTTPTLRLYYVNDAQGSRNDGRRGRFSEVQSLKLHAQNGVTFWRFNLEVELANTQSKIAYQINHAQVVHFWVPAKGQIMNIMFHSCNGFSLSVNPKDFCGPDPLWRDVLEKHKQRPFHVMLGGGDQIYNDAVSKQTTHFKAWLNIKTPFKKSSHEFTHEMAVELEAFYLERYSMWFSQGQFGVANSQIPMVNIWDDHDIIDGYGSYPNHFNRCPVFSGLGAVAFKYYMLFQHQSTTQEREEDEPSWILGSAPGPYITELSRHTFMFLGRSVAFLGLDCRTERMRDMVVSARSYDRIFNRLHKEMVPGETKHLIVMLGVPIAYPRLVWLETLLTSRVMDPIKALAHIGVLGDFLNSFDGGVELLDDLDDHWTAKSHKSERNWLMLKLQEFAHQHSVRVTILGGDVHLAGIGQFFSNHKLKVPKKNDHRYMPNVISSAIVNTPPPNALADILNKRNMIHHLDDYTDEDMYPIFLTDVDGTPRNNKRLLPRRNYCIIDAYDPESCNIGFETKPTKRSTFSKIVKPLKKKGPPSAVHLPGDAGLDGAVGSSEYMDPHEVMRDGLQVTLRMEINQRDPSGATKPYSFNVPALTVER